MQKVGINISKIRQDFPILKRKVNGNKTLVYLDNAATTQKPLSVINAIYDYYMNYNSNIHRAVHQLAEEATFEYEKTREKVAKFINARSADEIIFTRNATEAINLVSYSWGRTNVNKDDRIVITELEHHSNIVPWQILTQEKDAKLDYIGIDNNGYLNMEDCNRYLQNDKVKLLSISHMSNVLGTIVPINEIIELAHQKGIVVLVDGAQSVPHMPIDVQKMD
ncbi:MAG TPA: aminotransferase class V-fold PLP-dependent enzyme, partial [Nitrososphaeraceae archaeon]|nr:aminotransferase class V-fold PLP-dependent enzyme [Nitrososphaeraceae archaeon]